MSSLKDSQGIVSNFGLRGGGRGNLNVSEQRNFGNGDGLSTLATAALGCTEPCVNKKKEVHVHNHDDKVILITTKGHLNQLGLNSLTDKIQQMVKA